MARRPPHLPPTWVPWDPLQYCAQGVYVYSVFPDDGSMQPQFAQCNFQGRPGRPSWATSSQLPRTTRPYHVATHSVQKKRGPTTHRAV